MEKIIGTHIFCIAIHIFHFNYCILIKHCAWLKHFLEEMGKITKIISERSMPLVRYFRVLQKLVIIWFQHHSLIQGGIFCLFH